MSDNIELQEVSNVELQEKEEVKEDETTSMIDKVNEENHKTARWLYIIIVILIGVYVGLAFSLEPWRDARLDIPFYVMLAVEFLNVFCLTILFISRYLSYTCLIVMHVVVIIVSLNPACYAFFILYVAKEFHFSVLSITVTLTVGLVSMVMEILFSILYVCSYNATDDVESIC